MAAINFPTNRDQLNPPQPSGPLQNGDAFTDAGITWTWNASLGVWSAELGGDITKGEADLRYLRVDADAGDQERVAGEATFAELTTHEGGINVTGGNFNYNATDTTGIAARVTADTTSSVLSGIRSTGNYSGDLDSYFAFYAENGDSTGDATNSHGFYARDTFTDSADNNFGIFSNLGIGSNINYNFYADGDAPNWLTAGLQTAMPTDAWFAGNGNDQSYFGCTSEGVGLIGGIGHQGSYDCSIIAGGYRQNDVNQWKSLNVDGKNVACSVQVGASQPRISFCVEANKATGTSSGIVERATVTEAGFASINLFINVDADDPAAFQTTYANNGEEQTTYIGEQIDLKAVILELQQAKANLEARIEALEGGATKTTTRKRKS